MATPAGTAASRALAHARSFLGYRESPARSNRTRFGKQYGWDGVAWCVIFVWCILQDTGSSAGVIKTASTGAMERWAKSVGRTVTTPRPGDLIILRNSRGATIHTEFVYSYAGGRLLGLGGNTSGGAGSVADGGTVAINDRTSLWKRGRIRFVRPFYGVTTEDVKAVQTAARITVDGKIGPATVEATRVLQRQHGLTVDGFPGPATIAAITGKPTAKPAAPAKTTTPALAVDGKLGPATAKRIQSWLGVTADGVIGPATIRAWQTAHKTPVDGKITGQGKAARPACPAIRSDCLVEGRGGSRLVRSVQAAVGLTGKAVDGRLGPTTVKALQRHYNRQG